MEHGKSYRQCDRFVGGDDDGKEEFIPGQDKAEYARRDHSR